MLHKHCGLNKWEIFKYTLPQIINLLKNAKKHIQFEIEASMAPFKAFLGGGGEESDTQEITEDDIDFMEQMSQTF
jgi:hypothetical protein